MATHLDYKQITALLGDVSNVEANAFAILRGITDAINRDELGTKSRELLLRALEHRAQFGACTQILDALARTLGLFPYVDPDQLSVRDQIAYEFHRPFSMPDDIVFHREQAELYRRLLAGENVILSAPTSFGKSKIIDAIIATQRFANIAIVVPTLALIDETRRRLASFGSRYKLVTHLSQSPSERNIFVFTAERAVAYKDLPRIEFFAIDEFYKLDALKEDEERTVALNLAFYRLYKDGGQFYLLGPNIKRIPKGVEGAFRCSFHNTSFSTVAVEQHRIDPGENDIATLIRLVRGFEDPTLIFCRSPARAEEVVSEFLKARVGAPCSDMTSAAEWCTEHFHPDWCFGLALQNGIGIHTGQLPRSLGQFVVRAFNDERLRILVCTSTLIEGVNTRAKNVVVFDNTIAMTNIDYFTFNNIKGRSGRMSYHFVGRVYVFHAPPQENLPFVDFPLYTQSDKTPESLLVQMDEDDLSERSRTRLQPYLAQQVLPLEIIQANATVEPAAQIALATDIQESLPHARTLLSWRGFPEYKQLEHVCTLIWKHFVRSDRHHGVRSGKQLALKAMRLSKRSVRERILDELKPGKYQAKNVSQAVVRVLQFDRSWAGFELPRFLMAVSRIQEHILRSEGLPCGDYSVYARQLESLFKPPVVSMLDEYGIPMDIGESLQPYLRTTDNLDIALKYLARVDIDSVAKTPFERELLDDAKRALADGALATAG